MKPMKLLLPILSLALIAAVAGCQRNNYPPPLPPEGAEVGEGVPGSDQYPDGEYAGEQGENRYGYSGEETPDPPAPQRDVRDIQPSRGNDADSASDPKPKPEPKPEPEKPSGQPSASEMPYGKPVPGDPLKVTVPGVGSSISVEKIDSSGNPTGEKYPRGTPVEIPDPNNPGKKIYFKVP